MLDISNQRFGGFWIRVLASILDSLIIGIPLGILAFVFVFFTKSLSLAYAIQLIAIIVMIYMEGVKGGTPGKLILGLRVVNENSEFIGITKAILRFVGKILSAILLGIGFLMIAWDKKKQGLHDKIAKTFVIFKTGEIQPHKPAERRIDFFKKKFKKAQERKLRAQERKQRLKYYFERAGIEVNTQKLLKLFFNIAIVINLLVSAWLIYYFATNYGISWSTIVASMFVLWILVFILLIFAMWVMFYLAVDLKIFKRKVDIEEVLPDFLQLTASNINAGMTIDRALWFAVRPRFGVLAKEIETVAKETMSGVELKVALEKFASRYDSAILKRTVSMINEGIEAGGKIGDLLNRIATNIQEQKAMLKEMSANVTTYVIFITFATVAAAPFLFALSEVLIEVVKNLGSSLGGVTSTAANVGLALSFSGTGVTQTDFRIFAIVSLIITSTFSAMMISTIKRGNIKSGVKYIPIFIIISIMLYFIAQKLASKLIDLFI